MSTVQGKVIIVDAEGQILGRLASKVAKMLLEGNRVVVVNAEKAVLSGDPKRVIDGYMRMFKVQTYRNPDRQGIRKERSPQRILKAAIKGMLPYRKPRGRSALKRLRVYVGVPPEFQSMEKVKFKEADSSKLNTKYILVGDLAKLMGWRGAE